MFEAISALLPVHQGLSSLVTAAILDNWLHCKEHILFYIVSQNGSKGREKSAGR